MWHELLDHIGAGLMRFWEMGNALQPYRERPERPENDIALMMVMTALVAATNPPPSLSLFPLPHDLSSFLFLSLSLWPFLYLRLAPKIGQCNVN